MERIVAMFAKYGELEIIETPLDIYLEIPQLAYIEAKKPNGGKAMLFTKPMRGGEACTMPVLMNTFGSLKRVELIATRSPESIATQIRDLLNLEPPKGLRGVLSALRRYGVLRFSIPKAVKRSSAQEVRYVGDEVDLYRLPILTTWEGDSAPFITMGQVYTQSPDGKRKNLGLYRLQVHSRNELGLHWQIHKDSTHFFHEYKKAGRKMPVSIALGGDPLYTWCAQAPLPHGVYELMLYGVIKHKRVEVVRCLSNGLSVPADVDIIIEGFVDTTHLRDEGPFGDHTGFYTPIEAYPVLEITAITHKPKPIYPATIVGKPPLEDKYMGYLTERVFLPLLQTSAHGLLDYNMPENGVFHNLILAKLDPQYPGHARQLMHAFWGVGQMSFVKHAVFVGADAPSLSDYPAMLQYILDRFSVDGLMLSDGVCDALDHASPEYAYGGKLGLDVARDTLATQIQKLSDAELLARLKEAERQDLCGQDSRDSRDSDGSGGRESSVQESIRIVRQYGVKARVPIAIIGVDDEQQRAAHSCVHNPTNPGILQPEVDSRASGCGDASSLEDLAHVCSSLHDVLRIAVFVDSWKNDLDNPYMLVWRIVNNIDAKRDVLVRGDQVFIDARDKRQGPSHPRAWPKETDCSPAVIARLKSKGFAIDDALLHQYHICYSPATR